MLSKHLTNVIQNLEKKKFREKYNLYKVEGDKLVQELLLSDNRFIDCPPLLDRKQSTTLEKM